MTRARCLDEQPVSFWRRWEAPTWLVIIAVYGCWLALTYHATSLPWWILVPAGGWVVCWHGSLQHEAVHRHPTRSDRINGVIAWPPLALWMPYAIYRETHLAHHGCPVLTDPLEDTESFYVREASWKRMSRTHRAVLSFNNTLLGRLAIGPALVAGTHWRAELRRIASGDFTHAGIWIRHAAGVGLVLAWVTFVCDLPAWQYAAFFAYPGLSLTLLRSYAEHQPASDRKQRTAIVIGGPLSGLLYLNNNLHVVHHAHPGLAWYAIPDEFCGGRDIYTSQTGGNVYAGYPTILCRFLLHARDHPVHPEHRPA